MDYNIIMLSLENINGESIENATLQDIKKALLALFMKKSGEGKSHKVTIWNDYEEISLEVYENTLILQDWGHFRYDGPGGAGELLRIRVKEGSISYIIDEVVNLFGEYKLKELIKLLKSLPKPKEFPAKLIKETFDL